MPLLLARMIVIIAFQGEEPEEAIDGQLRSGLAFPAWFGLVGRVDAVGGLLHQIGHHLVGRLENGRAHQHLQLLEGHAVGRGGLETGHQVLDFLVLGQADLGWEFPGLGWGFFLKPIFNWARVCSIIC